MLDDVPATLAGCAALFSGYSLFNAYERTAFAEYAGGFWIPLVLLFILRERKPGGRVMQRAFDGSTALLAVTVAGSWLSNPTVGVMACYLLAAVALTLAIVARSWAPVLRASVGAVLGMGLVALYLVPAAWEQRWVDIHQVTEDPGQTLENNWLFARHADPQLELHDLVLHQASTIAIIMIAVTVAGILVCWLRGRLRGQERWWIPFALTTAVVLFLQFPASRPVWNLLPELRFLQFPWRWLVVLEAPMGILLVKAISPDKDSPGWRRGAVVAVCALLFLAMTGVAEHYFFQTCDDEDAVAGTLGVYRAGVGFEGTYEYEPMGADNSLIATGLPASCLVSDPAVVLGKAADTPDTPPAWDKDQGSCEATFAGTPAPGKAEYQHVRIDAVAPHDGYLILRLRTYPAWQVKVNGQPAAFAPQRDDGLMVVAVPQGPIQLTADWTTTSDVTAGRWLSGLALLLVTALCALERKLNPARLL
jgi:hypothetical protein